MSWPRSRFVQNLHSCADLTIGKKLEIVCNRRISSLFFSPYSAKTAHDMQFFCFMVAWRYVTRCAARLCVVNLLIAGGLQIFSFFDKWERF